MKLPKEKILALVYNYIQKEGIQSITEQKIVEITNVAITDIDYFFGSKEQLIEEVVELSLYYKSMFELK